MAVHSVGFSLLILVSSLLLGQSNPVAANVLAPAGSALSAQTQSRLLEDYGQLPLSFEANQGQTDASVKFLSRGGGYSLFLTGDEAVFSLRASKAKATNNKSPYALRPPQPADLPATTAVLRMKLVKANPSAKIVGEDELAGKSNYFIGNDPKKWSTNVANFAKVKYEGVYPGIDLVYYGNQRQLEYDFIVAPGADPRRIQFNVTGAKHIRRDKNGELVLQMAEGEVRWHKPLVYQEKSGTKEEIGGHYVIRNDQSVGFQVGRYDPKRSLTIDPFLVYSTYLGGSGGDYATGVALDALGNAYVSGFTTSLDFPATTGSYKTQYGNGISNCGDNPCNQAFIAKIDTRDQLVYATYLGGSRDNHGSAIAIDSEGNAYVTGGTYSPDFPTTIGAFDTTCKTDGNCNVADGAYHFDAFISKLSSSGGALLYSTFLGGSADDYAYGIALDSSADAYVTGYTSSVDFPLKNAAQSVCGNCGTDSSGALLTDVFITKLNPTGTALMFSTFLGGSNQDIGYAITVDASGNAYCTGYTESADFPTYNAFQTEYGGGEADVFVAKLTTQGSFVYATYLGGNGNDAGYGIAVDPAGDVYLTGHTGSTNFPLKNALQTVNHSTVYTGFVAKLDPSGMNLIYSTLLGGSGYESGSGIAIDQFRNAYVTGYTFSPDFPISHGLLPFNGGIVSDFSDAFVSEIGPTGASLVFSTFLGGTNNDTGVGIALDGSGNSYVAGATNSTNFPTLNPLQSANAGDQDAFLAKLSSAQVTISGSPQQPLTKNGSGNFVALLTIKNTGNITITSARVTTAGTMLGSAALLVTPPAVTNLAPGASATITLTFPDTAALSAATRAALKVSGTYSVPSVPLSGNWALSFRSVSL